MTKLAVIQIRGAINVKKKVKDALKMLRLRKKHNCAIHDATPSVLGMLDVVKDYVTWGEIDKETLKLLLEKRGKLPRSQPLTEQYIKEKLNMTFDELAEKIISGGMKLKDIPGLRPVFKLKPPLYGFESGGIKKPFSMGGALGYRKDKINDLVKRMV